MFICKGGGSTLQTSPGTGLSQEKTIGIGWENPAWLILTCLPRRLSQGRGHNGLNWLNSLLAKMKLCFALANIGGPFNSSPYSCTYLPMLPC